jgi:spermidine/putrescine transport system permease protein
MAGAAQPPTAARRSRRFVPGARNLLLLPAAFWTIAFFAIPLALIAVYSFGREDIVTLKLSLPWTTANYRALSDPIYRGAVLRSVELSFAATLGCALVGFPIAFFISRQTPRRQRLLLAAVMLPFWTSFLVRTYAWVDVLQNEGPIDRALRSIGLVQGHIDILYTRYAIAIGIIYTYLPLMVLPIYVSLERIDAHVLDAAADLGSSGARLFRRVVIPLGLPGLIAGVILVGVPATGEYVIPQILGGGRSLMIGNIVVNDFLEVGDYPSGAALAMVMMGLLMVVVVVLRRLQTAVEP